MKALQRELQFLFGNNTLGVTRVNAWLENNDKLGVAFTRQMAYKEIRMLFPFRKETHSRVYQFLALPELDQALEEGLCKWDEEEEYAGEPAEDSEDEQMPSTSQAARNSLRALYGGNSHFESLSMSNSANY